MDFNELKKLIKMVNDSDLGEVEVEFKDPDSEGKYKIRIAKSVGSTAVSVSTPQQVSFVQPPTSSAQVDRGRDILNFESPADKKKALEEKASDVVDSGNFIEVKAPLVGTFYTSPAPDADVYVSEGSQIKVGQTLCIIEAMKIMNEIESEIDGKIAKIVATNEQPVEYGQVLFLVEKN